MSVNDIVTIVLGVVFCFHRGEVKRRCKDCKLHSSVYESCSVVYYNVQLHKQVFVKECNLQSLHRRLTSPR